MRRFKLAEIKVRKLEPIVVKKIDELAHEKGMTRETFLRTYLTSLAITKDIEVVEDKYTTLVNVMAERLEQANDVIERNMILEEKVLEILGVISDTLE